MAAELTDEEIQAENQAIAALLVDAFRALLESKFKAKAWGPFEFGGEFRGGLLASAYVQDRGEFRSRLGRRVAEQPTKKVK